MKEASWPVPFLRDWPASLTQSHDVRRSTYPAPMQTAARGSDRSVRLKVSTQDTGEEMAA